MSLAGFHKANTTGRWTRVCFCSFSLLPEKGEGDKHKLVLILQMYFPIFFGFLPLQGMREG